MSRKNVGHLAEEMDQTSIRALSFFREGQFVLVIKWGRQKIHNRKLR